MISTISRRGIKSGSGIEDMEDSEDGAGGKAATWSELQGYKSKADEELPGKAQRVTAHLAALGIKSWRIMMKLKKSLGEIF